MKFVSLAKLTIVLSAIPFSVHASPNIPTNSVDVAVGGFVKTEISDDVRKAADAGVNAVRYSRENNSELLHILDAKKQVVAGINYDVVFMLSDGSVWNALVYRNLDDQYEVKDLKSMQTKPHFDDGTRDAVNKTLDAIRATKNESAQLDEILDSKVQVVSGRNYNLQIRLTDGTVWKSVVYRNLQDNYEVTSLDQEYVEDISFAGGIVESTVTPAAEKAASHALKAIASKYGNESQIKEIKNVRTQVVAGIAYSMTLVLEDESIWDVDVIHNPSDIYEVISVTKK